MNKNMTTQAWWNGFFKAAAAIGLSPKQAFDYSQLVGPGLGGIAGAGLGYLSGDDEDPQTGKKSTRGRNTIIGGLGGAGAGYGIQHLIEALSQGHPSPSHPPLFDAAPDGADIENPHAPLFEAQRPMLPNPGIGYDMNIPAAPISLPEDTAQGPAAVHDALMPSLSTAGKAAPRSPSFLDGMSGNAVQGVRSMMGASPRR